MTDIQEKDNRIMILDIMKGVCICMVIVRHVGVIGPEMQKMYGWPFTVLPAVPMFLMMSMVSFSLAEERKGKDVDLLSWFEWETFSRRFCRFLLPFFIAVAVEIAILYLRGMKGFSLMSLFVMLQQGGRGPGNYYVIIVFQLMLLFPFLRLFYKKNAAVTVLGLIFLNIVYERFCIDTCLDQKLYYVLIFRYLTHLALGMILYEYGKRLRQTALPMLCMITGIIYLVNLFYRDYHQVLVYGYPLRFMIPSLYSFGVLCYVFGLERYLQNTVKQSRNIRSLISPVAYIGKASWHIMLAQMVYFYFIRLDKLEKLIGPVWKVVLVDLVVSVILGCLFYALDKKCRLVLKQRNEITL